MLINATPTSEGATYVVDDDGGSWADHTSIQDALNGSSDNDTILIYSGNYDESIDINRSVDIIGNGSSQTYLIGQGSECIAVNSNNVSIIGLNISSQVDGSGTGVRIYADYIDVDNCSIIDVYNGIYGWDVNVSNCIVYASNYGMYTGYSVIDSCTVVGAKYGLNLRGYSTVDNCTLKGSEYGAYLYGSGTILQDSHISNCIIGEYISHTTKSSTTSNITFINCGISANGFSNFDLQNNDIWDCTVNGDPIDYYRNLTNRSVTGSTGQLMIVNCTNFEINGISTGIGTCGIYLAMSSNVSIINSNISSYYGILSHRGSYSVSNCHFSSTNTSIFSRKGYPTIDNCTMVDDQYIGIHIQDEVSNILITNTTISNAYFAGIKNSVYYTSHIYDCNISKCGIGIIRNGGSSTYTKIKNCSITDCDTSAIRIEWLRNSKILNCDLSSSTIGIQCVIGTSQGPRSIGLYDNRIDDCDYGIYIDEGSDYEINGNVISNCSVVGLGIYSGVSDITIENNTIERNSEGCYLAVDNVLVVGNDFRKNYESGINVDYADQSDSYVYHNNFIDNGLNWSQATDTDAGDGIYWDNGSVGNYWSDYSGSDVDSDGIGDTPYEINGSNDAEDRFPLMLRWNGSLQRRDPITWIVDDDNGSWADFEKIQDAIDTSRGGDIIIVYNGTYLETVEVIRTLEIIGNGSSNTTIDGLGIGNVVNITADRCSISGFNLTNASIDKNAAGIEVRGDRCEVSYNNFYICYGINLNRSTRVYLHNNSMVLGGISFTGDGPFQFVSHTIDPTNLLWSRPIRYYTNISSGNVPTNTSQVLLANCTGVTLENLIINASSGGIQIAYSDNCTISSNNISRNVIAVVLMMSENITIDDNLINDNTGVGVFLNRSHDNHITDNQIESNWFFATVLDWSDDNVIENNSFDQNDVLGLYLINSTGNLVVNNSLKNNSYYGLFLLDCTDNILTANEFIQNGYWGAAADDSDDNWLYHNNFIDNGFDPQGFETDGYNTWDNGSIGNYWSDYSGSDNDGNGIGDTEYSIDGTTSAEDRYPLMNPWNGTYVNTTRDPRTWIVDDDGGTWANYTEIQDAIDASLNGDTILVYNGTYFEGLHVDVTVDIVGNGSRDTIIDVRGNETGVNISSDGVGFSGFFIRCLDEEDTDSAVEVVSDNNLIANCTIQHGDWYGLVFRGSHRNRISNLSLLNNDICGLALFRSHSNLVMNCTFIENGASGGGSIRTVNSRDNQITYCQINDSRYGIHIGEDSRNNSISNCILNSGTHSGIYFWTSNNNTFWNNTVMDFDNYAIQIHSASKNNSIYLNSIYDNSAIDDGEDNVWDDGSKGNYWFDYDGEDINGDGIGDTPYELGGDSNSEDRYPLMNPWNGTIIIRETKVWIVDDDNGSWADFEQIQDAVNASIPGDTILVYEGYYYDEVVVYRSISLIGNGSSQSIIDGGGDGDVVQIRADGTNFSAFTLTNSGQDYSSSAIDIDGVDNCTIMWNRLTNTTNHGIWISDTTNSTISNNTINCDFNGVYLRESNNNTIEGNRIQDSYTGVYTVDSFSNTIIWNNITARVGVYLNRAIEHTILNNSMYSCGLWIHTHDPRGWRTHSVDGTNTVNDRPVHYRIDQDGIDIPNGSGQIILVDCSDVSIIGRDLSGGGTGIIAAYSSGLTISGNIVNSSSFEAIHLYKSNNSLIENNYVCDSMSSGIDLYFTSNCTVRNNTCDRNYDSGIQITQQSHHNLITDNNCKNTITVSHSDWNRVISNVCSNDRSGIYLASTEHSQILNNTLVENDYGIEDHGSKDALIFGNIITSSNLSGMELQGTSDSIIDNNTISGCLNGIHLDRNMYSPFGYQSSCEFTNNSIHNNSYGVTFEVNSDDNRFMNNAIVRNQLIGIQIEAGCDGNRFFLNNFIFNNLGGIQVADQEPSNYWDNGSIGNHWSDYNGSDENVDGIGDTPYQIDGSSGNEDRYPLMNPWNGSLPNGNEYPTASIVDISPNPASNGSTIYFRGLGVDVDGNISRYVWSSSIDGEFYNGSSNTTFTDGLSLGNHTIIFRVMDNGSLWSDNAISNLSVIVKAPYVNQKPVAEIDNILRNSEFNGEIITFIGHGNDTDGTIVQYSWTSSIDGEFYNGSEASINYSKLSVGNHTIRFRVMDNGTEWGIPYSITLTILPYLPDLSIERGDVDIPHIVYIDSVYNINFSIHNEGQGNASNVSVAIAIGNHTHDETVDVNALSESLIDIQWTPLESGTIQVSVQIIYYEPELNTSNNNITFSVLAWELSDVELSISESTIALNPAMPEVGEYTEINVIVSNNGIEDAENATVEFWLSGNHVDSTEVTVTNKSYSVVQFNWTPSESGLFDVNIRVNPDGEFNETLLLNNNASISVQVVEPYLPDLIITNDDITVYPITPMEGDVVLINVTIWNSGTLTLNDISVSLSFEDGDEIANKSVTIMLLDAITVTFELNLDHGHYNIDAMIDPAGKVNESNEDNNIGSTTFTVQADPGTEPDGDDSASDKGLLGNPFLLLLISMIIVVILILVLIDRKKGASSSPRGKDGSTSTSVERKIPQHGVRDRIPPQEPMGYQVIPSMDEPLDEEPERPGDYDQPYAPSETDYDEPESSEYEYSSGPVVEEPKDDEMQVIDTFPCPECNNPIEEGARFCEECGTYLG